jgi:hypothetical protein
VSVRCDDPTCDDGNLDQLSVKKTSGAGVQPLSGNTVIQVNLKLGKDCNDPSQVMKEFDYDSHPFCNINAVSLTNDPTSGDKEPQLKQQDIKLISPLLRKELSSANSDSNEGKGVSARIYSKYEIRHVIDGGDTIQESDDSVEYIQKESSNYRECVSDKKTPAGCKEYKYYDYISNILPLSDIPNYFGIYQKDKPLITVIDDKNEGVKFICYKSIDEAIAFIKTIKKQPHDPHKNYLYFPNDVISIKSGTTYSEINHIAINDMNGIGIKPGCGIGWWPPTK